MPSTLVTPQARTLLTVAATATTATSAALDLGVADSYCLVFNVTTASGTSPVLDIVVQTSPDGGTTYVNMPLRTAQKTATGVSWILFQGCLGRGEAASETGLISNTGGTLAKNCVFDPHHVKIVYTIGGTNPSFAFTVYLFAQPRTAGGY